MKKETKSLNQLFYELGKKQIELLHQDNCAYIECLVVCDSSREVMHTVYKSLISMKLIPKIEALPLQDKNVLWEQAKEFSKDRLDKNKTIVLSKSLYAIEYYLSL